MSKHTPGPWVSRYDGQNEWGADDWTMDSESGRSAEIAETYTANNACLIAAAPDLLEALQAMVDYYGTASANVDALKQARAAIAKATGEQA